jgi:hypothetical protein
MLLMSITSRLGTTGSSCTDTHARSGPFTQDLLSEAKLFGGAAARLPRHPAGALDQPLSFHKPAEILFVQANA